MGTGREDTAIGPGYCAPPDDMDMDFYSYRDYWSDYGYDYNYASDDSDRCGPLVPDCLPRGATITLGQGWKVVAVYLVRDEGAEDDQIYAYSYWSYGWGCCLAIDPVTSQVYCSSFRPHFWKGTWKYREADDAVQLTYLPLTAPSLDGLLGALKLDLLPESYGIEGAWALRMSCTASCNIECPWPLRMSCTEMMRYARSRLSAADPKQQQHRQVARHTEAVLAMCATFIWTCPQIVSAGESGAWRTKVWTQARLQAIVRLQAYCRGWLLRRSLYSPHTEVGQRRLRKLWTSFQEDQ